MVQAINYATISYVLESWEQLRRIPKFEQVAGSKLFVRLFEKCPDAKMLFGFPKHLDTSSEELLNSKRFLMHAGYMIEMIDTAIQMLGPDQELLTEIMFDLGTKHVRYGVSPEMIPIMGECLLETLQDVLKDDFTESIKEAWVETYGALSGDMVEALEKELKNKK